MRAACPTDFFFFFFKLAAPAALVQCRVVRVSTVLCNFNFSLSLCNIVKLTTSTEYSELDKVTLHPPAFQLDSVISLYTGRSFQQNLWAISV